MTKGQVRKHAAVATNGRQGPKPRINKTRDRKGYRVFKGKCYLGFFCSKKEAAACVRENDESTGKKLAPKRVYRYVQSHETKTKTVYYGVVRVPGTDGKKYFPRCDTPAGAAKWVAEYLHTVPKDMKVAKAERETPDQSADRMAILSRLFEGWIPADLASAITFRRRASSLQTSGPAAYVAGLLGKEDAWKEGLVQVWDAMPPAERLKVHGLGSRDKSMVQAGARALHDMLSLGFALWAGWSIPRLRSMPWPVNVKAEVVPPTQAEQDEVAKERQWWKLHVHRNTIHHLSLTPLALHLGIVKKTGRRGSLLIGNDSGEYYSLMRFDAAAHTKSLQALHAMGMVLNMLPVPRTNVDWALVQEHANAAVDRLTLKRSHYHWPWLVRTYMFAEMRHHGIMSVRVVQDWDTKELQEAIKPDQNEWLHVWMSSVAGDSLQKLLRRLNFTESLERLSVFACVMSDSAIMAYPIEEIRQRSDQIKKVRHQMWQQFRREANPALVLQSVMAGV